MSAGDLSPVGVCAMVVTDQYDQSIEGGEDDEVHALATRLRIPVHEAVAKMLERGQSPRRYRRNRGVLSTRDQLRLARTRLLVCGCGGLGGAIAHLVARLGFGYIRLVDPETFELSNANRQLFCLTTTMGTPKVVATKAMLLSMNPLVSVEATVSRLAPQHFDGVDVVLDALDTPHDKCAAEEECRRRGIPFVHGAVRGWWGQVTTVTAGSPATLPLLYGNVEGSTQWGEEERLGTLAHSVSLIASVQVNEAVQLALGRRPTYENTLFYWDGETGTAMIVPLHLQRGENDGDLVETSTL